MTVAKLFSSSTLALALGVGVLMCGQSRLSAQDQRDDAKPQQQPEARQDATKPDQDSTREDAKSPRQEAKPAEQSEDKTTRSEDKAAPKEEKGARNDDKAGNNAARQETERSTQQADHATQSADRRDSAGRGTRIPDDKFRSSFGRQHTFKVQRPTMVGGQPRFQYGGYSFALVDAWPADWAYTDDCYIDYIDGEYFLIDLAHPGVRLAIMVIS